MLPQVLQNTYEIAAENLVNFAKNGPDETGQKPKQLPTRETLLKAHEQNVKLLTEGNVPIRNIILPRPYPPSRVNLVNSQFERVGLIKLSLVFHSDATHR